MRDTLLDEKKFIHSTKFSFFLLGFSSIISWYSVILCLDYYSSKFSSHDVNFTLPIPQLIGQFCFVFVTYYLAFHFNLNVRIISSFFLMTVILLLLWIIPFMFSHYKFSYWLVLGLVFILGGVCCVNQTSSIALCYLFPNEYLGIYFLGSSFAGIFTALIRICVMLMFGVMKQGIDLSSILFIFISVTIIIFTIFNYLKLTRTRIFFESLFKDWKKSLARSLVSAENIALTSFKKTGLNEQEKYSKYIKHVSSVYSMEGRLNDFESVDTFKSKESLVQILKKPKVKGEINISKSSLEFTFTTGLKNKLENKIQLPSPSDTSVTNGNKLEFKFVYRAFKSIMPMPLFLFLVFIQTLTLFPGFALKKSLSGLDKAWSSILIILIYNIGETVGKYLTSLWMNLRWKSILILVILRFAFFANFYFIVDYPSLNIINTNIYNIANIFFFSMTHGYLANAIFMVAHISSRPEDQETTGLLMTIPLVSGLAGGSLLALIMKDI